MKVSLNLILPNHVTLTYDSHCASVAVTLPALAAHILNLMFPIGIQKCQTAVGDFFSDEQCIQRLDKNHQIKQEQQYFMKLPEQTSHRLWSILEAQQSETLPKDKEEGAKKSQQGKAPAENSKPFEQIQNLEKTHKKTHDHLEAEKHNTASNQHEAEKHNTAIPVQKPSSVEHFPTRPVQDKVQKLESQKNNTTDNDKLASNPTATPTQKPIEMQELPITRPSQEKAGESCCRLI